MIRAGGSSGRARLSTRVAWGDETPAAAADAGRAITGAETGGAVRTGVESPSACWKNARCAARASADGLAAGVGWFETTGGVYGRMTGGMGEAGWRVNAR